MLSLMHVGKAVRGSRKAGGAVEGKDAAVLMLLKNPALNKALKRAKFTFRANHGVNARALKPQDIPNICVGTVVGDKRLGSFDMFMLMT